MGNGKYSKVLPLILVPLLATSACTRAQSQKSEPQTAATSAPAQSPPTEQSAPGVSSTGGSPGAQSGSTKPTGPVGGDDLSPVSKLPEDACELSASTLARISPTAKLETAALGERAHQRNNIAVEIQTPFTLEMGWGRLLVCRWSSGNSSASARLEVGVADFAPVLYDAPGPERAHAAFVKLRERFQPDQMGASRPVGAPQDVSGLGEEAFRAAWADGQASAVVGRKGEVLIWLIGQPESGTGSAMADAMVSAARDLLDQAVSAIGTSAVKPVANTPKESLVTQGAVNAVWIVRVQDVPAASKCFEAGDVFGIEIPLATADATAAGYLDVSRAKGEEKVFLSTGRLAPGGLVGKGGVRVNFDKVDYKLLRAHLSIDTTLTAQEGGSSTTLKGELSFACP